MNSKLTSRKFWLAAGAFLVSVGTGIAGLATGNDTMAMAGGLMAVAGTGIYAACEAYVDGQAASANTTSKQITATSTDKVTVQQVLSTATVEKEMKSDGE